jgi:hypothetical protein
MPYQLAGIDQKNPENLPYQHGFSAQDIFLGLLNLPDSRPANHKKPGPNRLTI